MSQELLCPRWPAPSDPPPTPTGPCVEVTLLEQTNSTPGIVLTGAEGSRATMSVCTWKTLGKQPFPEMDGVLVVADGKSSSRKKKHDRECTCGYCARAKTMDRTAKRAWAVEGSEEERRLVEEARAARRARRARRAALGEEACAFWKEDWPQVEDGAAAGESCRRARRAAFGEEARAPVNYMGWAQREDEAAPGGGVCISSATMFSLPLRLRG